MKKVIAILVTLIMFMAMTMFMCLMAKTEIVGEVISPEIAGMLFILIFITVIAIIILLSNLLRDKKYINNISIEDAPENFKKLYEKLYKENIANLETLRKRVRIRQIIFYIVLGILLVQYVLSDTSFTFFSKKIDLILEALFIPTFILMIIIGMNLDKHKKKYKNDYKNEIIINFIKLINPNLTYEPGHAVDRIELLYKNVGFENRKFNRIYSDDYISGEVVADVNLKMVDLHLQNVTGSGKNRNVEEIFQGLFAITNCNRNISTPIKITKDKFKLKESEELVKLDSSEFESYFDVYSKDKILALQILTADTMAYLIDFYEKYMLDFDIMIKDNNIYMRFHTGAMFEPKIFGNSMEKELLFMYYCVLEFTVELTRRINKTVKEFDE